MPPKQVPQGTTCTSEVLQYFYPHHYRKCPAAETRLLKSSALDASPGSEVFILWLLLVTALVLVTERKDTNSSSGSRGLSIFCLLLSKAAGISG